ncbi:acyl carrier protein [Streptomyces sp. NRRL F-5126]|uniref:acyl carrier protein n=1 Tax=Streptomyces sp. NRRL F-5126 TaxID=1463857 RepID=UPI00068D7920|nr:acyl carrier protein [Streptomyces sp. NRRL F-5126]
MSSPMLDRFTAIMTEHFGVDPADIDASTTFEQLEMDSLALAETVVVLEEQLGIQLPDMESGFSPSMTLAEAADAVAGLCPTATTAP